MEFPESGAYVKNIMIFCGYKIPEAIAKLNDPKELNKMFKTVIELQELVPDHDKDEMFGIFRRNPSLLKILPGIEMEFKNFVKKVEILLPRATTSNRKRPASKTISTEAKMGKHRPSEAYLAGFKKLPTQYVDVSVETAMDTFNFKENANGSFTFNCLKCNTPCIMQNRPKYLSKIQLDIINKCWLNEKKKLKSNPKQSTLVSYFSIYPYSKANFRSQKFR